MVEVRSQTYEFPRSHKLPIRISQFVKEAGGDDAIHRLLAAARLAGNCLAFIRVFIESTFAEVRPAELVRLALRVLQVGPVWPLVLVRHTSRSGVPILFVVSLETFHPSPFILASHSSFGR